MSSVSMLPEAVLASAKAGIGIQEILEQIVEYVPAPAGDLKRRRKRRSLTPFTIAIVGWS